MDFLLVILFLFKMVQCARILGIFPLPERSHYTLASSLMRGLAEKGHDVTVINPFGERDPPKNGTYRDVLVTGSEKNLQDINLFTVDEMNFITTQLFMNHFGCLMTETTLSHPNVQKLLQSDETFDVVIVEQFVNDAMKVFAYHYKAPLVLFVTFGTNSWINPLVANPAPPSYIPEQNIHFDMHNFFDRVKNLLVYAFGEINRNFIFFPSQNRIMKKYFPEAPDLKELLYNSSLVLVNSHLSTNMVVPRVSSMIAIGGFHLKPPKQFPKDLQEFLDSAKDGVIFFSMGSALQSKNFPVEKRNALLNVFSKLKQKVLWKWEDDVLPGQPSNLKLAKWLPQQDILAHPNVKLFITHGGLLSLIESVHHGVPIVGIPVFGDQMWNVQEAVRNGYGRFILYKNLNEETFSEALNDVLNNQKYRNNMKRQSSIMNDRKNQPMDDVDYWIRYIIKRQGAPHLRSAALELSWYQYLCLDMVLFIFAITLIATYSLYFLIKVVLRGFTIC